MEIECFVNVTVVWEWISILYILFSQYRPRDDTRGNNFLEISFTARVYVHIKGAFDWPYSGIRMRRFTSKNHVYENFDVIGIHRRFVAPFPDKMLLRNRPAFSFREKSRGYSSYSYSRIGSIERAQIMKRQKGKFA